MTLKELVKGTRVREYGLSSTETGRSGTKPRTDSSFLFLSPTQGPESIRLLVGIAGTLAGNLARDFGRRQIHYLRREVVLLFLCSFLVRLSFERERQGQQQGRAESQFAFRHHH
jgi:hypothetical protein